MKIRKAVIPAAGLGTRFLPATKTVPKELLPIVDRPILLFIVEEALNAGLDEIVLISGRGKTAIEDFFDTSYELEALLERTGKTELLKSLTDLRKRVTVISVRQQQALGLGHAVLTAESVVKKEPFAVLLGDEIMVSASGVPMGIHQLVKLYQDTKISSVAVMEVPEKDVTKYGIISGNAQATNVWKVDNVVEKPSIADAPSRLALPGRYVFDSAIFSYLRDVKPGRNGEIQLTDGMTTLARKEGLLATTLDSKRFDAGDKLGFVQANIEMALQHPEIGTAVRAYLKQLSSQL